MFLQQTLGVVSESFSSVVLTVYAVLLRTVFHQYLNKKDTQRIEQIPDVVSCYVHAISSLQLRLLILPSTVSLSRVVLHSVCASLTSTIVLNQAWS